MLGKDENPKCLCAQCGLGMYYLDSSFGVESNGMGSCCVAGHWEGYIINKKRQFPHNPTAAEERPPQQRKRSAVASSPLDK